MKMFGAVISMRDSICELGHLHSAPQFPVQRRLLHYLPASCEDPQAPRWSLCQSEGSAENYFKTALIWTPSKYVASNFQ